MNYLFSAEFIMEILIVLFMWNNYKCKFSLITSLSLMTFGIIITILFEYEYQHYKVLNDLNVFMRPYLNHIMLLLLWCVMLYDIEVSRPNENLIKKITIYGTLMIVILLMFTFVTNHCLKESMRSVSECFTKDRETGHIMGFIWIMTNLLIFWGLNNLSDSWDPVIRALFQNKPLIMSLTFNSMFVTFLCMINPTGEDSRLFQYFHKVAAFLLFVIVPVILILCLSHLNEFNFRVHVFAWLVCYHGCMSLFNSYKFSQNWIISDEFYAIFHSLSSISNFLMLYSIDN
jgi:hypothetical protein